MNCRPNDLAVVVDRGATGDANYDAYVKRLIGRVVTVTKVDPQGEQFVWTIRHPFWMRHRGDRFLVTGIQDRHLQPLRGAPAESNRARRAHAV
ncbi:conserved hypothetical protein [Paraburkholderia tropica]